MQGYGMPLHAVMQGPQQPQLQQAQYAQLQQPMLQQPGLQPYQPQFATARSARSHGRRGGSGSQQRSQNRHASCPPKKSHQACRHCASHCDGGWHAMSPSAVRPFIQDFL